MNIQIKHLERFNLDTDTWPRSAIERNAAN